MLRSPEQASFKVPTRTVRVYFSISKEALEPTATKSSDEAINAGATISKTTQI
jgi:hypothetical protein